MIGIILCFLIIICVLIAVRIRHGCFFKPVFRDDVAKYARDNGLSDKETIKFINDNRESLMRNR